MHRRNFLSGLTTSLFVFKTVKPYLGSRRIIVPKKDILVASVCGNKSHIFIPDGMKVYHDGKEVGHVIGVEERFEPVAVADLKIKPDSFLLCRIHYKDFGISKLLDGQNSTYSCSVVPG